MKDFGCTSCPNDTFCFEYLLQNVMRANFHDIETLNRMAMLDENDFFVTKISAACLKQVSQKFVLLNSGSAFAFFGGPKLVSTTPMTLEEAYQKTIFVPGLCTTACRALEFLCGKIPRKRIENSANIIPGILLGTIEVGIAIHEPMSVSEMGLFEILDIGLEYKKRCGYPLPLGVLVARKHVNEEAVAEIEEQIRSSIHVARSRGTVTDFVRQRAPHLSDTVIRRHIESYVGDETESLSPLGRDAIEAFCSKL